MSDLTNATINEKGAFATVLRGGVSYPLGEEWTLRYHVATGFPDKCYLPTRDGQDIGPLRAGDVVDVTYGPGDRKSWEYDGRRLSLVRPPAT